MRKASFAALVLAAIAAIATIAAPVLAQDPVKVDSKHYKVEFENEFVRVLRITYGPGEKSVMHEHPNAVATFLTESKSQFHLEDGSKVPNDNKKGSVLWTPAGKHLPENTGDKPFELILVEVKTKAPAK